MISQNEAVAAVVGSGGSIRLSTGVHKFNRVGRPVRRRQDRTSGKHSQRSPKFCALFRRKRNEFRSMRFGRLHLSRPILDIGNMEECVHQCGGVTKVSGMVDELIRDGQSALRIAAEPQRPCLIG